MSATATHHHTSPFRTALKWGGILGLTGIIMFTIGTLADVMGFTTAFYLIEAVLVFVLVRNYRKRQPGGILTFGAIFSMVFQAVLYSGIIYEAYTYVFYHYISPASFEHMLQLTMDRTRQQLLINGLTENQIEQQLSMTRRLATGTLVPVFGTIGIFALLGALMGLVTAAALKKEQTEPLVVE